MGSFITYILTAFALVFVIEGLLYALFPDMIRRMMHLALSIPLNQLRFFGLTVAIFGFSLVLLIRWMAP